MTRGPANQRERCPLTRDRRLRSSSRPCKCTWGRVFDNVDRRLVHFRTRAVHSEVLATLRRHQACTSWESFRAASNSDTPVARGVTIDGVTMVTQTHHIAGVTEGHICSPPKMPRRQRLSCRNSQERKGPTRGCGVYLPENGRGGTR